MSNYEFFPTAVALFEPAVEVSDLQIAHFMLPITNKDLTKQNGFLTKTNNDINQNIIKYKKEFSYVYMYIYPFAEGVLL